jgi:hypothetical protein
VAFLIVSFIVMAFIFWRFADPWRGERIAEKMGPELPLYGGLLMIMIAIENAFSEQWIAMVLRLGTAGIAFGWWFQKRRKRSVR